MMRKVIPVVVVLLLASSVFAQTKIKTELPPLGRLENEEFQEQREKWIRSMHRAEPGLNWQVIDAETRAAKAKQFYLKRASKHQTLVIPTDTFADGRLVARWVERGSVNVAGRTHTADIDFETDTIFIASSMGNIWKAKVGDSNFTVLNDAERFGDIRALRILHTAKGKRLFAACNGPVNCRYSDDGGNIWREAAGLSGPKSWGGIKRAIVSADEKTIYLIGSEWDYVGWKGMTSLYKSVDQGTRFTQVSTWDLANERCDIWQSRDTTSLVYLIKGDSLFSILPTDKLSFLVKIANDTIAKADAIYLDGKVSNKQTTLALCAAGNNISAMFTSIGDMKQWIYQGFVGGSPFSANSFRISLDEPTKLYFGDVNVHSSTDSHGEFEVSQQWWEYYGDPLTKLHADIDGIDIFRNPTGQELVVVSTDGGTYLSDDAMSSATNLTITGIRTSQYYSTYTSAKPYVVHAGAQDQGFQRSSEQSSGLLHMDQIISGDYGHIVSGDQGESVWGDYPGFVIGYYDARNSADHRDWSFVGSNKLWIPPIVADLDDAKKVYVACGDSLNDQSHLWELTDSDNGVIANVLPFDFSRGNKDRNLSSMAFSPFNHSVMYALSNDGYFFRSTNKGQTWKVSDTNEAPSSHYFYGSVILPSTLTNGKIWVAGSGYSNSGVYVSTDDGKTFVGIDSGLPKTMVFGLAATDDEQFLFAATEVGPYVYSVAAKKWYDLQTPTGVTAPDMVYWSLERVPQSNTFRFGTYGRGIWDLVVSTGDKAVHQQPSTSNMPLNFRAIPVVSSAPIQFKFDVPSTQEVTISLYDLSGKRVRIFSQTMPTGANSWLWNGESDSNSPIPSGFYTAIIKIGSQVEFAKVEIVR